MEPLLEKIKITNNTPYHISYKKSPKIPKGFSFDIEGDVNLNEIEVWYGGKWTTRPEVRIESNTVVFKKIVSNEQEELSGFNLGLSTSFKGDSSIAKLFKKIF